jgi:hypothetical protein
MKLAGGGSLVCLAWLGLVACSSPAPPPAEGSASMLLCGGTNSGSIHGPGGQSNIATNFIGQTVLDGRDGYAVSCTVSGSGTSFGISGEITAPDLTYLSVNGSAGSGSSTVSMAFLAGRLVAPLISDAKTPCTLTTIKALRAGSIWAAYSCPSVSDPNSPGTTVCTATGEFVFTGCGTS